MTARCRRPECGRPLRTEESRARGYGPVCWSRLHPTEPRIAAPVHAIDPEQIPLPLENHVTTVDAETRKQAIDTIAWHALARHLDYAVSVGEILWEDYPDLGEVDWDDVLARVEAIAVSVKPTPEHYRAAYQHLTGREGRAL